MKRRWFTAALAALPVLSQAQGTDAESVRTWLRSAELDGGPEVRRRLAAGQDPNVIGAKGQAALHWALLHQSASVVTALLEDPRTDVELLNAHGESPLMLAALRGRLDWVKALVQRGAKIDPEPATKRWRALHYAASGEDVAVVVWLLEQGASLDALSPNGSTALMMAWGYGLIDAGRLLLQRGASSSIQNDQGQTAWDFAKRGGREDLARKAGLKPGN